MNNKISMDISGYEKKETFVRAPCHQASLIEHPLKLYTSKLTHKVLQTPVRTSCINKSVHNPTIHRSSPDYCQNCTNHKIIQIQSYKCICKMDNEKLSFTWKSYTSSSPWPLHGHPGSIMFTLATFKLLVPTVNFCFVLLEFVMQP